MDRLHLRTTLEMRKIDFFLLEATNGKVRQSLGTQYTGVSATGAKPGRGNERGCRQPAACALSARDPRLGIRRRKGVDVNQLVDGDGPKAKTRVSRTER